MKFSQVDSNLYRGSRPESPQDFAKLPALTVINLETGAFEWFHNRNGEEDSWGKAFYKTVIHLPLSDFCAPTKDQINKFLSIAKDFTRNGPVFFHCLHGEDRTGFMTACYRMKVQKWSRDAAIKEMLDMGFHKFPYSFWMKEL